MPQDYIPSADGDFLAWEQSFMNYVTLHAVALGIAASDVTALTAAQEAWEPTLPAAESKQAESRAAIQLKNTRREVYEALLRAAVRRLQASATMTDEHRRGLAITVRDDTHTIPTAPPVSRPMVSIDTSQRLCHTLRFFDENTPRSRARPAGVKGCEIWRKIGTAPADPCECSFLALDTASPYVAEYEGADAGKMAYYMLRWISNSDEKGHWSELVGATIVG